MITPNEGAKYTWDRKNVWLSTNDLQYLKSGTRRTHFYKRWTGCSTRCIDSAVGLEWPTCNYAKSPISLFVTFSVFRPSYLWNTTGETRHSKIGMRIADCRSSWILAHHDRLPTSWGIWSIELENPYSRLHWPFHQHLPTVNFWLAVTFLQFLIQVCFSVTVIHPSLDTTSWQGRNKSVECAEGDGLKNEWD